MKTIYLTILFLLLVMLSGCSNSGRVVLSADNNEPASYDSFESNEGNDSNTSDEKRTDYSDEERDNSDDNGAFSNIYVFVCGHVNSPGVYELNKGSRVCDALELAGGISEDGVPEALEQAKEVVDGQTIYVPGIDEEWERTGAASSDDRDNENPGQEESGININTATKDELMTLPGIGESKATDIIQYRDEHGSFNTIEEIMNIQGIKEGVFNKIKDLIRC